MDMAGLLVGVGVSAFEYGGLGEKEYLRRLALHSRDTVRKYAPESAFAGTITIQQTAQSGINR